MPPKVLICDRIHEKGLKILKQAQFIINYFPEITYDQLLKVVDEYDCLVVRSRTKITAEILSKAKKLKLIVRAGSGLDNIDREEAQKRGVKIVRCPEAVAPPVAELTIAFMILLARKLDKLLYSTSMRKPPIKNEIAGRELFGKTLGVIGVGSVGRIVVKLGAGFGMKLLLNDIRSINPMDFGDAEIVDLETLLRNSDFVTIHIPLDEVTRNLLDSRRLSMMKQTAYLINTSRPEIVDPRALYTALKEGWIAGAAFEVTEEWLKENSELLELDNFICTPHVGSRTEEAYRRVSEMVAEKILKEFETPNVCIR